MYKNEDIGPIGTDGGAVETKPSDRMLHTRKAASIDS